MSTFSETVIEIWNEWEIRALLLLSLLLQVILIALGSLRKRSTRIWIRFLVWSAYMSADLVATVALGILARNIGGNPGNKNSNPSDSLQLFWTPFLILHLGGPDTITAYSLEDNELWPRHFLGLLVQTGIAFYVFVKSWGDTRLKLIAIPVFIAGIIKYGERTWVLRTSSTKCIRHRLLSDPDPGPDYAEVMRKKQLDANFKLSPRKVFPQRYDGSLFDHLSQAYYLFNRLKYLFADLILGYYERQDCHSMISNKSSEEAFELVEGELGLLYDVLYTKATIVYSRYGFLLRCSSFSSSVFAMISFAIFIEHPYSQVDISVTYLLLVGAIALEVYAFVLLILSDWTKLWLVTYLIQVRIGKRWSRTMFKYNLIKFCLRKQATMWIRFQKILGIEEVVEKHLNVDCQDVDAELQKLIFQQLKERSENINSLFDVNSCKKLLSYRGDCVLDKMNCLELLKWSTIEVEFDHSLLLWHIATQLCYYEDVKRLGTNYLETLSKYSNISQCLSDYMLYLLVMYPNMLPKGIGEIRYRDTCSEATRFFQQRRRKIGTKIDEACHELYEMDTDLLDDVKGDATKSVLFYGCRLAKQLQYLESQKDWGCAKKWDMISKVWVELLAYAAVNCGWREHGQQLRRGGELLTHVCLLMAHLGLSEQYQIKKEYFRISVDRWLEQCSRMYKKRNNVCTGLGITGFLIVNFNRFVMNQ
ncbi:uncharacterized protein LOC111315995 [Durio zibethinus]|uniref:Uncharacterized protein LOC111315995 n=1 Tax=Durio zibethinus TaxID=66656 RepID=A0A6P6B9P3_DURZI|nr:uncharacterized protein LOC111315995 [Durio zibethinus]XP_022773746.1 uncharacterized protein LOC111315995 [Durio zibethinus]